MPGMIVIAQFCSFVRERSISGEDESGNKVTTVMMQNSLVESSCRDNKSRAGGIHKVIVVKVMLGIAGGRSSKTSFGLLTANQPGDGGT